MADWSPYTYGLTWPQNRLEASSQKRLAALVRPHLHPDEAIVAILSGLYQLPTWLARFAPEALAVTSQRLFVIQQGNIISLRSMKILGISHRDGLKVEWDRFARVVSGGFYHSDDYIYGKLSVLGSFGAKEWWVGGNWRLHRVATIAMTLK
jgi:hypothetical protein